MARSSVDINWRSGQNIFLNPRWPEKDRFFFEELIKRSYEKTFEKTSDLSLIWLATSGTSSSHFLNTKLVAIQKSCFLNSAEAVVKSFAVSGDDIWGNVLPIFHVGGLSIYARAFVSGSIVIDLLKGQRWDVEKFIQSCLKYRVTIVSLVPTHIFDLVQKKIPCPSTLRIIFVGGGFLDPTQHQEAMNLGWPIITTYGMTETSSQIAFSRLEDSFEILPHAHVRINLDGFIEIKASCLFDFYAFVKEGNDIFLDPKKAGWFTTEDLGSITSGRLFLLGRQSDFFKIGGEGTSLKRLNHILTKILINHFDEFQHSFCIFDGPSDRLGKETWLIVENKIEEAVVDFVFNQFNREVLPFERIRQIKKVDQIPYSELGKLKINSLRQYLENHK